MTINITNGEVELKNFCSRKLKKEINKVLYGGVELKSGTEGKSEMTGFNPASLDKANDTALVGMVEKITINGLELDVNLSAFDEMDTKDVEKIIDEINKITNKEIPNA